ncbi:replicative DNA helicase [Alkalicoccobacillus plakortidis]|uniref:Replicative DNA helicase n=1 Tax=Alkalicoccobacillus plakortidis TaxID=444060 RepID=A0ABT0XDR2_9BACI|nr:replicative DNA helicase [Alkalicoccobacillus plakortidis]MCM2674062.1 replicative DNA helicase [Alkalicoccobacillus plakortidis]
MNDQNFRAPNAAEAVLGSILYKPDLIKESVLVPEEFQATRHQKIFETMRKLDDEGKAIDMVALATELGDEQLQEVGGVPYFAELANAVATTANFKQHEAVVQADYRVRKARNSAYAFTEESGSDDAIDELIKSLQDIKDTATSKLSKTKKEILQSVVEKLHSEEQEITGAQSGIVDLDRMTGGWQRSDLIIVAARPSVGKTAFALNMGGNHCSNKGVTTVFSLEMPAEQLVNRWLSAAGHIDGHKWRNPSKLFTSNDYEKAINAIGLLEKWDFEIVDDAGITVQEIRSKMRQIKRKYPNQEHLVIIDYLQLIASRGGTNRQEQVSEISRSLKQLARELDMPIIALSQLSRGVEQRQDKRPMMSDIRESGSIEQDADVVAFLYRDDYYDKESENQNIIEIILAKQRNGPIGTAEAAFIKEYGKFVNLDRRHNDRLA